MFIFLSLFPCILLYILASIPTPAGLCVLTTTHRQLMLPGLYILPLCLCEMIPNLLMAGAPEHGLNLSN